MTELRRIAEGLLFLLLALASLAASVPLTHWAIRAARAFGVENAPNFQGGVLLATLANPDRSADQAPPAGAALESLTVKLIRFSLPSGIATPSRITLQTRVRLRPDKGPAPRQAFIFLSLPRDRDATGRDWDYLLELGLGDRSGRLYGRRGNAIPARIYLFEACPAEPGFTCPSASVELRGLGPDRGEWAFGAALSRAEEPEPAFPPPGAERSDLRPVTLPP